MTTKDEENKQRLKDLFRKLDPGETGSVSRLSLWSIFQGVGIDKLTAQATLDAADVNKDGSINLDLFFDWLFASPEMRRTLLADHSDAALVKTGGPLFIGTLNFLGNAYNAIEFMNTEPVFQANYKKIRESFAQLTCGQVLAAAEEMGFEREKLAPLLKADDAPFQDVCSKDFLGRDNKFELNLRTNMVVAGMMPTSKGPPLYHSLKDWKKIMEHQVDNYKEDQELALWDVACNLAVEGCKEEYETLCGKSYLNPELILHNVQTLLQQLPKGRDVVCAVQEFPEKETPKYFALLDELPGRGLKAVKPQDENSSVGFILSADLSVLNVFHAPLGRDPEKVYMKIQEEVAGMPDWKDVGAKDRESLKTTAFKTFVMDIDAPDREADAKNTNGTPLRFVDVHAKEFKTEEGTKLLAAYLKALCGKLEGVQTPNAAVVMLDSNTPDATKSKIFDGALADIGFQVLSPADAAYTTTRKQRSQMHGQIYDNKKCLKTVSAHKTFVALLQRSPEEQPPVWEALSELAENDVTRYATPYPNLVKEETTTLPYIGWPTDHCMLQVQLKNLTGKQEAEAS